MNRSALFGALIGASVVALIDLAWHAIGTSTSNAFTTPNGQRPFGEVDGMDYFMMEGVEG